MYFCALCPSVSPKERSRQALDRLPLVSNFLTNFWMQHFDGARLSPNSIRNAVWHALNEPVCQYLRTRNPRCSTVYIDNSLGALARDSPCSNRSECIYYNTRRQFHMYNYRLTLFLHKYCYEVMVFSIQNRDCYTVGILYDLHPNILTSINVFFKTS